MVMLSFTNVRLLVHICWVCVCVFFGSRSSISDLAIAILTIHQNTRYIHKRTPIFKAAVFMGRAIWWRTRPDAGAGATPPLVIIIIRPFQDGLLPRLTVVFNGLRTRTIGWVFVYFCACLFVYHLCLVFVARRCICIGVLSVSVAFLRLLVIPFVSVMLILLLLFPSIGIGCGVATFVSSAVLPVHVDTAFISCA
jgi:hypothetical protein